MAALSPHAQEPLLTQDWEATALEELHPGKRSLAPVECLPLSTGCSLGTERDTCPNPCPSVTLPPSSKGALILQTHHCHAAREGFVLACSS